MYLWRKLTLDEREQLLAERIARRRPWHSPPRWGDDEKTLFHLTAACYEHAPLFGFTAERMDGFVRDLQTVLESATKRTFAWCVLTNHYHLLVETQNLRATTKALGQLHGRVSFAWNGAEGLRGRKCFQRVADRAIRNDRHFWATMNYIHHNPVRHGYVEKWTEWPWSSAHDFLGGVGREAAARLWREYPLHDYGAGWDEHVVPPLGGMPGDFPNELPN